MDPEGLKSTIEKIYDLFGVSDMTNAQAYKNAYNDAKSSGCDDPCTEAFTQTAAFCRGKLKGSAECQAEMGQFYKNCSN